MRLGIAEILEKASQAPVSTRAAVLRQNYSTALEAVILLAYDPRYVWDFEDKWKPKYTPCIFHDQEGAMYQAMRTVKKFLVGGHPTLTRERKQVLFVQLLESVTPADAELLIAMMNKRLPYRGLGKKVIDEAFPGLISDITSE